RSEGRHAPVRRINDEGTTPPRQHFGWGFKPESVIAARNARLRRAVFKTFGRLLVGGGGFFLREDRLLAQVPRALEGRSRVVGPSALQVRMAIRRARDLP